MVKNINFFFLISILFYFILYIKLGGILATPHEGKKVNNVNCVYAPTARGP